MQVNEQIGSGDWSDGAELGSTWEGRNSFSYGRQTPSVGLQSQGLSSGQGQIAGLATESVCERFLILILMPCMLCSTSYSSSQIFTSSHQRLQFYSYTNVLKSAPINKFNSQGQISNGQQQGSTQLLQQKQIQTQKQSLIRSKGKEGGKEGGQYRPEVLSTLLSTTERIVQQIDSVE